MGIVMFEPQQAFDFGRSNRIRCQAVTSLQMFWICYPADKQEEAVTLIIARLQEKFALQLLWLKLIQS
jgi:hypothetical protein